MLTAEAGNNIAIRAPLDNLVGKCEQTRVYTNYDPSDQNNTKEYEYEYRCFEKDKNWGYLSATFMCIPGVFFWAFLTFR